MSTSVPPFEQYTISRRTHQTTENEQSSSTPIHLLVVKQTRRKQSPKRNQSPNNQSHSREGPGTLPIGIDIHTIIILVTRFQDDNSLDSTVYDCIPLVIPDAKVESDGFGWTVGTSVGGFESDEFAIDASDGR
jgi:hypothetical protein